jgi:molybdopterin/thiamine biosynthesis adenylyltransferase
MRNKIYARQTDLVTPKDLSFPILMIGAGGIGSWTSTSLTRMGCKNLTVVDHDLIEEQNVASQAYLWSQVGSSKALELSSMLWQITEENEATFGAFPMTFQEFFKKQPDIEPEVIICALDSMDERIKLWDVVKEKSHTSLFIDARMGGELLKVYAFDPLESLLRGKYEKTLYPSSKADPMPCTARSIIYTTFFCGGVIANYIKRYAKKQHIRFETIMDFDKMELI